MPGTGSGGSGLRPLELMERALAWIRPALLAVPGHDPATATPCRSWDLADLLAHLLDGFTAFAEAATGRVQPPGADAGPRDPAVLAGRLLDLSGVLLGGWTSTGARDCRLDDRLLPAETVLQLAGLEIAVHGWDLAQVTGPERRLPAELAAALLPVAYRRVGAADRQGRFAPPVEPAGRDPSSLLLAHLGRRPGVGNGPG